MSSPPLDDECGRARPVAPFFVPDHPAARATLRLSADSEEDVSSEYEQLDVSPRWLSFAGPPADLRDELSRP